jgi:hypothetical protein
VTRAWRYGYLSPADPDRVGLYRAVATRREIDGGADVCARDRSPRRRHSH